MSLKLMAMVVVRKKMKMMMMVVGVWLASLRRREGEDKRVKIFCRRSGGGNSTNCGRCGSFLTTYFGYSHDMSI